MGFIEPGRSIKKRKIKKVPRVEHVHYSLRNESILERLPQELLHMIFVLAGLKENNLPLTNKYLYNLLRLNYNLLDNGYWPGKSILMDIVDVHFKYNLNRNINISKIKKKIQHYSTKIPDSERNDNLRQLKEGLIVFEQIPSALVVDMFNYRFISTEFLDLFNFEKSHALEYSVIMEEITERPKFIKEHERALTKEFRRLNLHIPQALSEDECDNMARMADEVFNANTSDIPIQMNSQNNHDTKIEVKYSYATYLKTPKFPTKFYDNITQMRLIVMSKMSHFGFYVEDKDKLVINTILSFDRNNWEMDNWQSSFSILLSLSNSVISTTAVIEGFEMIMNCKPENKRSYYAITNHLLDIYYCGSEDDVDDTNLWHYIIQTKNHEYIDMIMQFAGTPNNEILALMNT